MEKATRSLRGFSEIQTNLRDFAAKTSVALMFLQSDGMRDGMPVMTHRTTFSLDEATAARLKRLAVRWQVSQAEVVRRALAEAEARPAKADPIAMLNELHASGRGLDPAAAEAYLAEVREDRKRWRDK
jgi:hypothetical protein